MNMIVFSWNHLADDLTAGAQMLGQGRSNRPNEVYTAPLPTKLVDPVTLSDLMWPSSVCGLAESLACTPDTLDLLRRLRLGSP
jgi:hypothetical protein